MVNYTSENGWNKEKLNAEIPLTMESGREITKLVEVHHLAQAFGYM